MWDALFFKTDLYSAKIFNVRTDYLIHFVYYYLHFNQLRLYRFSIFK